MDVFLWLAGPLAGLQAQNFAMPQLRHTSLMAFYTALFCTAFAIAALASDTWFINGAYTNQPLPANKTEVSGNMSKSVSIGLLSSTWHFHCEFADSDNPLQLIPEHIKSSSKTATSLFAVTVVFGLLCSGFSALCGISVNSGKVRFMSIATSVLFFVFFLIAFGIACGIKHSWDSYLHDYKCRGRLAMGGAFLVGLLGVMTIPIIPIFIASDAYVDDDYKKVDTEMEEVVGASAPRKF